MFIKKVFKLIKNPNYIILILLGLRPFRIISDKTFLKIKYWLYLKKKLNLSNPTTFNEKLQWLKLYDRKKEYIQMVDKYEVREYIAKTIGKEYLIPLLGVYNTFDEINFNQLPDKFVLKPNHTSGNVFICKDKSKINYQKLKKDVNKWLSREYYWLHREWPYKNIKPKIICEKFITANNEAPDDFKVLCFNGKAKLIELHRDRFGDHNQDFYDENWNKTNISQGFNVSNNIYPKPKELDLIINLSEQLASDLYHVRIDWFIVDNTIYFGEITFYDGAGFVAFDNQEDDQLLGGWIKLPV
jgi:hypothetical protein